ncbi:MAG: hypothetical protein MI924_05180 [Chloroflexales bacterium]|nr:hypothetical protein [Chloroflexales bacterium]
MQTQITVGDELVFRVDRPQRKAAQALVAMIGAAEFRATLQRWLPLVDRPRTTPIRTAWEQERHPQMLQEQNTDLLRSMVWLWADYGDRDTDRALTMP